VQRLSAKRKLVIIVGVLLGMLLGALDQTVVGTAMPRIISELRGMNLYSWVFTAYMLASTAAVPIFGKLSDIYGRKTFYLLGIGLFLLGSWLSGAAASMVQLIIFRGLQGLGGGIMMANSMAIVGDIFPPAERGKWQGVMGAAFGLASIIGPVLGGYITDHMNWRWVFYVNLPVGLLALAVLGVALPKPERGVNRQVDYWGAAALLVAVIPLLLGFSWAGTQYPWLSTPILGLFALAALGLAAFIWVESRAAEPIIPLSLFANPIFTVSALIVFTTGVGMFGAIMFVPLFMQGVLGITATYSGLILTPMMLSAIFASAISGQIMSRWGRYRILSVVGTGLVAAGMALFAQMTVDTPEAVALRNMVITGLGMGVTMPIFVIVVQNALPYRFMGVVTAAIQFFRSVGGTVGVAIMGSLMSNRFHREMANLLPPQMGQMIPLDKLQALENPQALLNSKGLEAMARNLPPGMASLLNQVLLKIKVALATAISQAFWTGTFILLVAFALSFFLREIPLRRQHHPDHPQESQVQ